MSGTGGSVVSINRPGSGSAPCSKVAIARASCSFLRSNLFFSFLVTFFFLRLGLAIGTGVQSTADPNSSSRVTRVF
ncbi:hypothetical protein LY76DRAFT_418012 [Colletotrichum caudatum]|nr:hypothetical protein LY76DRAFT_418012 [Colletotrichum caudatum]